jgi:methionyl-tRNA formyltransferase
VLAAQADKGRLRVAFFGTPEFAVPTLEQLIEGRHEVVAVVCQPDRSRGRGRRESAAPVAEVALRAGIHLMRPERIGDPDAADELRAQAPDLGVVVAFGQFLPKQIREMPSLGYLINGHASLLPRYRGAAPISACILNGDTVTGSSAMRVEREMDTGPVALQREVTIGEHENRGELSCRLAALTADTIEETVEQIAADQVVWTPQDARHATVAPKIEGADRILTWSEAADALVRQVRAMAPTPGAFTTLDGETLQILDARSAAGAIDVEPGVIRFSSSEGLQIATGSGWLLPRILKRPGKRALPVDEFLRGRSISGGARLV